jgi:hypothetical protein
MLFMTKLCCSVFIRPHGIAAQWFHDVKRRRSGSNAGFRKSLSKWPALACVIPIWVCVFITFGYEKKSWRY